MPTLRKLFPVVEWLPGYKRSHLSGDLFAGLTVGVMLIPQGMAYALIAGLPPVYGLYASIIPQLLYAIFGTSRQLSVAPAAMDSLIVAAGVAAMATEGTEAYIGLVLLLAGLTGAFQLLLGLLRLGFVTNLLSKPVISGFTSAAAVTIGLYQLKYLLGIDPGKSSHVHDLVLAILSRLGEIHWITFGIGVAGILIIRLATYLHKSIPGGLIAVASGILVVELLRLQEVGVSIVGIIPSGFPAFHFPSLESVPWGELIPLAMTLALIGFMESFSVAKAFEAKKRNHKVRPSQELVALGVANLVGSLFRSYPVSGGFARSAVNFQSGANTPLASVFSALLVALILVFLTPLFYYLPHAILASVIMVAVARLIDLGYARQLWKDSKVEFGLLLVTFLVTLYFSMVTGIVTGIALSVLLLLYKSAYPHIARLGRLKGHHEFRNVRRFKDLEQWDHLLILRVDSPLTFINIQYFKDYVENAIECADQTITTVILDAGPVSYVDASASAGLRDLLDYLNGKQVSFLICDLIGPVRDMLKRTGLGEVLNSNNVFFDLNEAVKYVTTHEKGHLQEYALQANIKE